MGDDDLLIEADYFDWQCDDGGPLARKLMAEITRLRADLAAARALLKEARDKMAGAVEPDDVALNARIDAALKGDVDE